MWTPGRAPSPKGGGGGRNHFHPMDGSAAALPPKLPPHRRRKPKRKRPVGPPRAEGRSGGARRRDSDGDGDSDSDSDSDGDRRPSTVERGKRATRQCPAVGARSRSWEGAEAEWRAPLALLLSPEGVFRDCLFWRSAHFVFVL